MSALRRFMRSRARARRCRCLRLIDGRPCQNSAVSRILYRLVTGAPLLRVDACGLHDGALMVELSERHCRDIELKEYVRPRAARAKAGAS